MEKTITLKLSSKEVVEILTSLSYARDQYARNADFNYRDYWEKSLAENRAVDEDILNQLEEQRSKENEN